MNKIMILKGGSSAIHKLGDIGREVDDYIRVHGEDEDHYIGNFEEGFGFIDVKFKKTDCRPLTLEEREKLNGKWYTINGNPLYRIYVDKEGNVVKGKVTTIKGVIEKVTDAAGNEKHADLLGLQVEFGEDMELGQSLIMLTNQGAITTSKVSSIYKDNGILEITTGNSVYYISTR